MDQQLFKAEVKKQLYLRNWSYVDLAEHTGYTVRSLRTLMCYKRKMSPGAIEAISRALSIEPPS